jgi:triacylglycerol lipase
MFVSACAAPSGPPPPIAAKIAAGGAVVDGPAMNALYAPFQEHEPYVGLKVERDLAYGPLPENLADVFTPQSRGKAAAPVLIFVHGGGFIGGERRTGPGSPFYDNVGVWAARHGFIGVDITYRRAPKGVWPAAAQDVGAAVDWVRGTIAQRGGDPSRIYLMGHSAGATHVASYVGDKRFWGADTLPIRGAIIVSGSFTVEAPDAAPPQDRSFLERASAYFGKDPAVEARQASLPGLARTPTRLLIVNAQYDPPYFQRQAAVLAKALDRAPAGRAKFIVLPGHNHMSQIYAVNTADHALTQQIELFARHDK